MESFSLFHSLIIKTQNTIIMIFMNNPNETTGELGYLIKDMNVPVESHSSIFNPSKRRSFYELKEMQKAVGGLVDYFKVEGITFNGIENPIVIFNEEFLLDSDLKFNPVASKLYEMSTGQKGAVIKGDVIICEDDCFK